MAVFDAYGVVGDESRLRNLGSKTLDYVLGRKDALLRANNRAYGVVDAAGIDRRLAGQPRHPSLVPSPDAFSLSGRAWAAPA